MAIRPFEWPKKSQHTLRKAPAKPAKATDVSDPTRCAWCGEGERSGAMIVPFGTEVIGHTWLHSECWRDWYAKQRGEVLPADAEAAH